MAGSCIWPRGIHLVKQNGGNLLEKTASLLFSIPFYVMADILKAFVTFWRGQEPAHLSGSIFENVVHSAHWRERSHYQTL